MIVKIRWYLQSICNDFADVIMLRIESSNTGLYLNPYGYITENIVCNFLVFVQSTQPNSTQIGNADNNLVKFRIPADWRCMSDSISNTTNWNIGEVNITTSPSVINT